MRARRRGQAVAEFAVLLASFFMVASFALSMLPAVSVRGDVIEVGEALAVRLSGYLPPAAGSSPSSGEPAGFCRLLDRMAREMMGPDGLGLLDAATTARNPQCAIDPADVPSSADQIRVYVRDFDPAAVRAWNPLISSAAAPKSEVCLVYRYSALGGVHWQMPGGADVSTPFFVFRHCAEVTFDGRRSQ